MTERKNKRRWSRSKTRQYLHLIDCYFQKRRKRGGGGGEEKENDQKAQKRQGINRVKELERQTKKKIN